MDISCFIIQFYKYDLVVRFSLFNAVFSLYLTTDLYVLISEFDRSVNSDALARNGKRNSRHGVAVTERLFALVRLIRPHRVRHRS